VRKPSNGRHRARERAREREREKERKRKRERDTKTLKKKKREEIKKKNEKAFQSQKKSPQKEEKRKVEKKKKKLGSLPPHFFCIPKTQRALRHYSGERTTHTRTERVKKAREVTSGFFLCVFVEKCA